MARVRLNREQIDITAQTRGRALVQALVNSVESGARTLIPIGDHRSGSGAPARDITLLSSVYSHVETSSRFARGRVGAKTRHAETVHQGSQPHVIRSKRGKMLKFRWDRGDFLVAARAGRRRGNRRTGQFHFFVSVRHPGNKRPVRFLTTPLQMFGRAYGFLVFGVGRGRTRLP